MGNKIRLTLIISLAVGALAAGIWLANKLVNPPESPLGQVFASNIKQTRLSDFSSDFLILDFWASWCLPCVDSLPHYQKLFDTRPANKLQWVAVNQDLKKQNADNFLKKYHLQSLPVFYDPQAKLQTQFNIKGLPTLIVLNQDREEIARITGYAKSRQKAVEETIEAALTQRAAKD